MKHPDKVRSINELYKVVDLPHIKAYAMLRLDFRDGPRAVHFSMRTNACFISDVERLPGGW